MAIAVVTAPTTTPVTRAELQLFARIPDNEEESSLLDQLITAATGWVQSRVGCQLVTATYRRTWDEFPSGVDVDPHLRITPWPLVSVTSLAYVDGNGASATLTENTHFIKEVDSRPARLLPYPGLSWPITQVRDNAVTLTFVAGFGDATHLADIPHNLKHAVLRVASLLYENRDANPADDKLTDALLAESEVWSCV